LDRPKDFLLIDLLIFILGAKKKAAKKADTPKRHPNSRLKPNEAVKVLKKDPFFETKGDVPFVSSVIQSKLAIRAVLTK